jgi:hypothetical protein
MARSLPSIIIRCGTTAPASASHGGRGGPGHREPQGLRSCRGGSLGPLAQHDAAPGPGRPLNRKPASAAATTIISTTVITRSESRRRRATTTVVTVDLVN